MATLPLACHVAICFELQTFGWQSLWLFNLCVCVCVCMFEYTEKYVKLLLIVRRKSRTNPMCWRQNQTPKLGAWRETKIDPSYPPLSPLRGILTERGTQSTPIQVEHNHTPRSHNHLSWHDLSFLHHPLCFDTYVNHVHEQFFQSSHFSYHSESIVYFFKDNIYAGSNKELNLYFHWIYMIYIYIYIYFLYTCIYIYTCWLKSERFHLLLEERKTGMCLLKKQKCIWKKQKFQFRHPDIICFYVKDVKNWVLGNFFHFGLVVWHYGEFHNRTKKISPLLQKSG